MALRALCKFKDWAVQARMVYGLKRNIMITSKCTLQFEIAKVQKYYINSLHWNLPNKYPTHLFSLTNKINFLRSDLP